MRLHETLPFTDGPFFLYAAIAVGVVLSAKLFLSKILPYKWVLGFASFGYLLLFYPKPIHLIGLVLYEYFTVILLKKYYKKDNIIFPMVVLALPIFVMKTVGIMPNESGSITLRDLKNIIQIAGLSYLVFKVISLYLDERRGTDKISLLDFFNFTAFVPTLLIGPLDRFKRFNEDIKNGYDNLTLKLFYKGWRNFTLGLLFKFIIAESIRRLILVYLVDDGTILYHIAYGYTYLFYLFFDFAGYSLLAIGLGNFLGIHVPINFDKPFLATNPKEFWKKWHKTLGDWLNDYFFKPIFKDFTTRKIFTSIKRQNLALMLTFTLMGFWNGFELHYIVSGMLFGVYSVGHNYYVYRCKKGKKDVVFGMLNPKLVRLLSIIILFNLVTLAIYVFSGKLI